MHELSAPDITYVRTWEGWLYLAVILDAFSRRVVGWALADHLRAELALDALQMALANRQPPPGLIHHSDRGGQYLSAAYIGRLAEHGARSSVGRPGTCWDNAVPESFFATLKLELLHRAVWPTRQHARTAIFHTTSRASTTAGAATPLWASGARPTSRRIPSRLLYRPSEPVHQTEAGPPRRPPDHRRLSLPAGPPFRNSSVVDD